MSKGWGSVLYLRKEMIRCGMECNLNGVWEIQLIFPKLQDIIHRYKENFIGVYVAKSMHLNGHKTDSDSD